MKTFKHCQSCGMPFSRDEKGGGTELNGEKSRMYCSHCYENGSFVIPDLTAEEMKERVQGKIVEFGAPRFMAKFFTRKLHKLERWKSN
ncbi:MULTISPECIES: zinc ribbon domain-containing protein [unclassified Fictibacillus]|uniref:zinc ribbon domain-containing protein n=1 Tax=unclassified Fictibacillus TaxID=2644029 RepID=UPI000785708F|nr:MULTISPECIES: zinc ribbon domain-containing protein [unclassified Fictibacillus]MED2971928.1 zinc ribbon domain-containing protein [Fictibacillus sp. B-59209]